MSFAYSNVLDWVERLPDTATTEELWKSFLAFAEGYGFRYGALADVPEQSARGSGEVVALHWPDGWYERYAAGRFFHRDPMVRALSHSRAPYTWAEGLTFGDYSQSDRSIVFAASDHGLLGGFVVPISGIKVPLAVLSVAGEQTRLTRRERAELHFAAIHLQSRVHALRAQQSPPAPLSPLSLRERECLEWAAVGKTDWEIGEILSISERTAGSYIERAKQKLGVATRIQAIVIALKSGAISV